MLWFAALRALVAGIALFALGRLQGRRPLRGRDAWLPAGALGVVNVTVAFAAMFRAVAELTTGTAAVVANAQPLLIVVPAWWLKRPGFAGGSEPTGRWGHLATATITTAHQNPHSLLRRVEPH